MPSALQIQGREGPAPAASSPSPSPVLDPALLGTAGACPHMAKSCLHTCPALAPERPILRPSVPSFRAYSLAHSRCSVWNEALPTKLWPPLLSVLCVGKCLAWDRLCRMLWGFPALLTRGFFKLCPGEHCSGIPGLPLGMLGLAGGSSQEEGEPGPLKDKGEGCTCAQESQRVRGRTPACR